VLLLGRVIQGAGPDGPVAVITVLIRILESGVMLALLYTAISIGIASLTDRRAIAAAATLFVLLGSGIVAGTLVFGLNAPHELIVLHLIVAPLALVSRIYGVPDVAPEVSTVVLALGVAGWTVVMTAVAVWRYQRLQVTR
jgi:hypothetical protein